MLADLSPKGEVRRGRKTHHEIDFPSGARTSWFDRLTMRSSEKSALQ
jgi:hypothetical protein